MKKLLLGMGLILWPYPCILTSGQNYVKAELSPFHKKKECLFKPDLKCVGTGMDCVFEDPCGNGPADM